LKLAKVAAVSADAEHDDPGWAFSALEKERI